MGQRLMQAGVCLSIVGAALSTVAWFDGPPERLDDLTPVAMTLSVAPFLRAARKSELIALISSSERTLRLSTVCDFWTCTLPSGVAALRPGDKLTVWRDGIIAWQINSEKGTVYSFSEAADAHSKQQLRGYVFGAFLVVLGLVLITFNRKKDAL